jgi:hypothetical protein
MHAILFADIGEKCKDGSMRNSLPVTVRNDADEFEGDRCGAARTDP